eukprot:1169623-Rhodomonas_salina.3
MSVSPRSSIHVCSHPIKSKLGVCGRTERHRSGVRSASRAGRGGDVTGALLKSNFNGFETALVPKTSTSSLPTIGLGGRGQERARSRGSGRGLRVEACAQCQEWQHRNADRAPRASPQRACSPSRSLP